MSDEELEKVARAATPGPWKQYERDFRSVSTLDGWFVAEAMAGSEFGGNGDRESNGAFIAAFNPATALALLERVRKAERPSHPTAEHSQRVVTALEEMLAPLSGGTLGNRDVVGRVSALLDRVTKAEARVRELEDLTGELRREAKEAFQVGRLLG